MKVTGLSKLELTYCVKHNQHAKHAKARGVWGHAPQENLKIDALRLNLRVIFQEFKLLLNQVHAEGQRVTGFLKLLLSTM